MEVKKASINPDQYDAIVKDKGNIVLEEVDTKPTKIGLSTFEAFRAKTEKLIQISLRFPDRKDLKQELAGRVEFKEFEIPNLWDIIVEKPFYADDVRKVRFLLRCHEKRLRGEEVNFHEEMLDLCKVSRK